MLPPPSYRVPRLGLATQISGRDTPCTRTVSCTTSPTRLASSPCSSLGSIIHATTRRISTRTQGGKLCNAVGVGRSSDVRAELDILRRRACITSIGSIALLCSPTSRRGCTTTTSVRPCPVVGINLTLWQLRCGSVANLWPDRETTSSGYYVPYEHDDAVATPTRNKSRHRVNRARAQGMPRYLSSAPRCALTTLPPSFRAPRREP